MVGGVVDAISASDKENHGRQAEQEPEALFHHDSLAVRQLSQT